jgi:hypothetical protein
MSDEHEDDVEYSTCSFRHCNAIVNDRDNSRLYVETQKKEYHDFMCYDCVREIQKTCLPIRTKSQSCIVNFKWKIPLKDQLVSFLIWMPISIIDIIDMYQEREGTQLVESNLTSFLVLRSLLWRAREAWFCFEEHQPSKDFYTDFVESRQFFSKLTGLNHLHG